MGRFIFRGARAYLFAMPLAGWIALGCSSSTGGTGQGGSGGGNGGGDPIGCSVGTSGSVGTVCIKWPQEATSSMSASTGVGSGGAGGAGGAGGMAACPSASDATQFVNAIEPHVAFVTGEGAPGTNGTCCYSIIHDFCY